MKKFLTVLLMLVLVLALVACGGSKDPENNNEEETKNVNGNETLDNEEEDDELSFTFTKFGKAKITIKGAELKKDEDDEDFIRVYYDYLNMGEYAVGTDASSALTVEVKQGEEEIDIDEFGENDEDHVQEDLFYYSCMYPGTTLRNTMIIYCDPEGGPVEVACHVMIGSWMYNEEDVEWFKFTLDPKNLTAPKDTYEIKPIENPTYTKDMPKSGTSTTVSNPYTLSLNGYELTTCDDKPAIRVKMTYTHQHDWEMSPYTAVLINAYQDGIALEQATAWDIDEPTDEDEAYEEDVKKGDTVECNALFILRGDNPVEVVVEQPLDDTHIGMLCTVK